MRFALIGIGVFVAALLAIPLADAKRPPDKGPPDGGGGPPSDSGTMKGDLYADLVRILRDEDGRPILTRHELVDGTGFVYCIQPISPVPIPDEPAVTNPADGRLTSLIPLGTGVEGEECDVPEALVPWVEEIIFGRLNVGRSPERVLAQQLREVTRVLDSSLEPVQIDESGRFVVYLDDDGDATTDPVGTGIDSPGNNLAIHQELQEYGRLLSPTRVPIPLPAQANSGDPTGYLDHAASALGAAAGKGDLISLDLLVYNNRILGIPGDTDVLPTLSGGAEIDDPDFGPVQIGETDELYIDYDEAGYAYTRSQTFPGCVRGYVIEPTTQLPVYFEGTVLDCVFGGVMLTPVGDTFEADCAAGTDFTGVTAVHAYAQRADDARAVIAFTHDNVVADSTALQDVSVAGVDKAGESTLCDALGL